MSQTEFSKIHQLAEFLGITMDIKHGESITAEENWEPPPPSESPLQILQECPQVLQSSQQVFQNSMSQIQVPEIIAATKVTGRLLPKRPKMLLPKTTKVMIPKASSNTPLKVFEKVITPQDLTSNFTTTMLPKVLAKSGRKVPTKIAPKDRTKICPLVSEMPLKVTEIPGSLPICCWHCNLSFPILDDLKQHLISHVGELPKNGKRHKCQKCKKVKQPLMYVTDSMCQRTGPLACLRLSPL